MLQLETIDYEEELVRIMETTKIKITFQTTYLMGESMISLVPLVSMLRKTIFMKKLFFHYYL